MSRPSVAAGKDVFIDRSGTRVRVVGVGVADREAGAEPFVELLVEGHMQNWRIPRARFESLYAAVAKDQPDVFRYLEEFP